MTLDTKTVFIVLGVACLWWLASYSTYRFLATVTLDKRDWVDRTRLRRTAWVVFSPAFWLFYLGCVLWYSIKYDVVERWKRRAPGRKRKKLKRQRRRQHFLFDPSD